MSRDAFLSNLGTLRRGRERVFWAKEATLVMLSNALHLEF
jgi:hypothetical protein